MLLDIADEVISYALSLGAKYADVRVQRTCSTNIRMVKDHFEYVMSGIDQGLGVRVLCNNAWGFSSVSSLKKEDFQRAAESAVKTAKATSLKVKEKVELDPVKTYEDAVSTPVKTPLKETEIKDKMNLVTSLSKTIREYSPKIVSATAVYGEAFGEVVIATSEGTKISTKPSKATVGFLAVAKEAEKITSCSKRLGSPGGYEIFEKLDPEEKAKEVAARAVNLLKAKPAPSGRFTVIVDPELAGVFAHEAVGHACEGDHVVAGESVLKGKIGQRIGSEQITIYDDPTYPNGWGSFKYDMEGVLAKKRLLIEKGILKEFITNREVATRLGIASNGGARTQSYAFRPIVRMSNTCIAPGDYTLEEMLEDINRGVYVKGTRGGQVDPAKGTFQFSAMEAYMIEHGEITTPLLSVSLSGLTLETLKNINAVAKDFDMHIGYCGKEAQSVPTADGSPHIRIKNAVVGGMT
jgi:TldD protein